MKTVYQVFVSSTFVDLKDARAKVIEKIEKHNCLPKGMELFPATNEEKFNYIKRMIDESDCYLLILGGRYGSVDKNTGMSWTEREYRYAKKQCKPIVAFIISDEAYNKLPVSDTDVEDKDFSIDFKRRKLKEFKKSVQEEGGMVAFWSNADELASNVGDSLNEILPSLQKHVIPDDSECTSQVFPETQENNHTLNPELESLKAKTGQKQSRVEKIPIPGTSLSVRMVLVEGGKFMMGTDPSDVLADDDEKFPHEVILSDYYIGETVVTQELWAAVMKGNYSDSMGAPNLPKVGVSWNDCIRFIDELKRLTKRNFNLPTEAQWEFAARGGNKRRGCIYAGNNDPSRVAWYADPDDMPKGIHAVAEKAPNELGLYDMSGNVNEWCLDWYDKLYRIEACPDPKGPLSGSHRVYRGGRWDRDSKYCRVSSRNHGRPTIQRSYIGFRLVLELKSSK